MQRDWRRSEEHGQEYSRKRTGRSETGRLWKETRILGYIYIGK